MRARALREEHYTRERPEKIDCAIFGTFFRFYGTPIRSSHWDGSYELLSICVETLAGINAKLSGVDLFFQ